jgi:hypothetical protein
MPSLQVVTWAKGWHVIDVLKGRTGIGVVLCTYVLLEENFECIVSSPVSRLGLPA